MNIHSFIGAYHNHPILFIGTGLSLRYLTVSYTWDALLKKIAIENLNSEAYIKLISMLILKILNERKFVKV